MPEESKAPLISIGSRGKRLVVYAVLAILVMVFALAVIDSGEPETTGGPPMVRRLTEEQYRNSISDIFGPDIEIAGRFERPFRAHGLIAVGTGQAGISPFAVEQYEASAQIIAATVLSEEQRASQLDCSPADARQFDVVCASAFLSDKGRMLFRRPLADFEVQHYVGLARNGAEQLGDFHDGLRLSLYAMLVAPDFLFRIERVDPEHPDQLDPFSRAERLSFFLTNAPPDDELLRAAEDGDLDSTRGIRAQADRLIASDRFEGTVRNFFSDMMEFDSFGELAKDPEIYPAFNSDLALDAQEQTLKTIIEHVVENDGDYRDLFTLRDTYLTRALGVVNRTPVPAREGWQPVTFAPDAGRAGIQSHVSFLALHSHPGRSSPTLRGYALRQVFLCQEVPDPPSNVNFTEIEEHVNEANVTARDRLSIHNTEPSCAGCHKVMDPLGLTLESFDGVGTFRTHENGELIDLSGELDGTPYATADGLAEALRDHPETPRCLAQRMYTAAVGRDIEWGERYYLDWLIDEFADDDYSVPDLMRRIATSENFFTVTPPRARRSDTTAGARADTRGSAQGDIS
ncbi:DUF1592 domain-containing protein [Erythrobacter alti]|uniref:DUF1592 domain-containing protein n=1 Tax=Erythrobacter alti TaxID=1896145 RepID=UPI0030F4232E